MRKGLTNIFLMLCLILLCLNPLEVKAENEDWGVIILSESHWGVMEFGQNAFNADNNINSIVPKQNYKGFSYMNVNEPYWHKDCNPINNWDASWFTYRTNVENQITAYQSRGINKIIIVYFSGTNQCVSDSTLAIGIEALAEAKKCYDRPNEGIYFRVLTSPLIPNTESSPKVQAWRDHQLLEYSNIAYVSSYLDGAYQQTSAPESGVGAYDTIINSERYTLGTTGEYSCLDGVWAGYFMSSSVSVDGIHYASRHYWVQMAEAVNKFVQDIKASGADVVTATSGFSGHPQFTWDGEYEGRYAMYEHHGSFNLSNQTDPLIGCFQVAAQRVGAMEVMLHKNTKARLNDSSNVTGSNVGTAYANSVIGDIIWAANYENFFDKQGSFPNCSDLARRWREKAYLSMSELETFIAACNEIVPDMYADMSPTTPNAGSVEERANWIYMARAEIANRKTQILIRVEGTDKDDGTENFNYYLVESIDDDGNMIATCYTNKGTPQYKCNLKKGASECGITECKALYANSRSSKELGLRWIQAEEAYGWFPHYPIKESDYTGIQEQAKIEKPVVDTGSQSKPTGVFTLAITGTENYNGFNVNNVVAKVPGFSGKAQFVVASDLHVIRDSGGEWDIRNSAFGGEDRSTYLQTLKSYALGKGIPTYLCGDIVDQATRNNYDSIKGILNNWGGLTYILSDHDRNIDLISDYGIGSPATEMLTGMSGGVRKDDINGFKVISLGMSTSEVSSNASGYFKDGEPTCILTHVPLDVTGVSEYTATVHTNPYNWKSGGRYNLDSAGNMRSFNNALTSSNSCYFVIAGHTHQKTVIFQSGNHAELLLAPLFTKEFCLVTVEGA